MLPLLPDARLREAIAARQEFELGTTRAMSPGAAAQRNHHLDVTRNL